MIQVLIGDLLESRAQTLVNTVNCVGIMGKGIALEFKKRFPDMYADYVRRCEADEVKLGEPYLYRMLMPPWILNFPTKTHWKSVSRLSDIVAGLEYLEKHYREWGIESLAVPPLGCGFGQLDWRVVGPTLYRHLSTLEVPVELYAPLGTPAAELDFGFLEGTVTSSQTYEPVGVPKIDPEWVTLVEILARESNRSGARPISKTHFQALTYFADQAGIHVGLQYRLGRFGLHSPDFDGFLHRLANNGLCSHSVEARRSQITVGPTYADAVNTFFDAITSRHSEMMQVVDVLKTFGAQAHFVAGIHLLASQMLTEDKVDSAPELYDQISARIGEVGDRNSDRNVKRALDYLLKYGWLDGVLSGQQRPPRVVPVLTMQ